MNDQKDKIDSIKKDIVRMVESIEDEVLLKRIASYVLVKFWKNQNL